jgi:hypothetical protein
MEVSEIAVLLGRPSTDPRVEAELARFGIDDRPRVKIDELDTDSSAVAIQDWVINNALGIEFGFDAEGSWHGWGEFERGRSPMILTQIYFYGDHEDVHPYRGPLPFGLQLTDDRSAVRAKLAALEGTRRSYVRDTWEPRDFRLTVSYVDDGARIGFVLCMLREPSLPGFDYSLAPSPTIEAIIGLLGKGCNDSSFRDVFAPIGLDRHLEVVTHGGGADFRNPYGFELGFSQPPFTDQHRTGAPIGPIFSYVMFYRERELGARGWQGTLPLGILFDDSPEVVTQKVGLPADEQADEQFTGYALWHLPNYSLHVYYSTMENLILRVRVMAPGVWAAYQAALKEVE